MSPSGSRRVLEAGPRVGGEAAFEGTASAYDSAFTDDLLGRCLRDMVWSRLEGTFAPGQRVVDLGCGTGEDAVWLAQRGIRVHAVDASAAMLEAARRKALAHGVADRIAFAELDLVSLRPISPVDGNQATQRFDGALSNFGALNCLRDRRDLAAALADSIVPGGRLAVVVMGPLCPWEWLWYLARGNVRTAFRRLRRGAPARLGDGVTLPVWYPSPRRLRREMASWFRPLQTVGIGVITPGTFAGPWIERRPRLLRALAAADKHLGRVFPGTWLNDHYLTVFERTEAGSSLPSSARRPPRLRRAWRSIRAAGRAHRAAAPQTLAPRAAYDLWAPTYAEGMNPVQTLEAAAVRRLLPETRERLVLDLGCGKGRCSALALEGGARKSVGVDLSSAMLRAAARSIRSPGAHWAQGDLASLPFRDARFDVAFCALALGHVPDLDAAIAEMARVLRPSGVLLLSGFHPFATLRGWQRTFTDAAGRTHAIRQHLHLFEDYWRCFHASGLVVEALEEPRHEGFPLVFVLRARKFDADAPKKPAARTPR